MMTGENTVQKNERILEVNNLKKYFNVRGSIFGAKQYVKAVDDVSIYINKGETLGVVGESGCGKTTLGRTIIRLYDVTAGEINFKGQNIAKFNDKEMLPVRKSLQMIYQDPYSSLNPRMTVSDIISEPLVINKMGSSADIQKRVRELLGKVGLSVGHASRYPHEFSGGQRQRIGIARTLAMDPELIICDEPISALDVSIQAQIVNLLQDLQNEMGLTYMFIAHDLSMVKYISSRIAVMYLGKVVETGSGEDLYRSPKHPYTEALLSAIPLADPDKSTQRKRIILEGSVPSPINPPSGCRFRTRCQYAMPVCSEKEPVMTEFENGHQVACHLRNGEK